MEQAWAQAQRPGANFRLEELKVEPTWKFPVFMKEKLGLQVGSMVFFIDTGAFRLDPLKLAAKARKKWARTSSTKFIGPKAHL